MYFKGDNSNRLLITSKGTVPVHNTATIYYVGTYLKRRIPFIGTVEGPRIVDSEVIGIYVRPTKIYLEKWYYVKIMEPIPRKFIVYPELLTEVALASITSFVSEIVCTDTIELDPNKYQ